MGDVITIFHNAFCSIQNAEDIETIFESIELLRYCLMNFIQSNKYDQKKVCGFKAELGKLEDIISYAIYSPIRDSSPSKFVRKQLYDEFHTIYKNSLMYIL